MRVLVTGGAGFIGAHLCRRLVEEGHEVICLDNFFTGSKSNIESLLSRPRFELIRHDVTLPILLEVDQIYNLACPASPIHYQYNPVKTIKTNILGTLHMLGLAKRVRARILQASTSEVYGDPTEHPQREEYWGNVNPIGIRSCYDADTEILTENGWVRFPKLQADVRVATLNSGGQIEYYVPDECISYPYSGELLHFANAKFDLCVTPNHKMYVRSKMGRLRFLQADEDRHWPDWKILVGGEFSHDYGEWNQPPSEVDLVAPKRIPYEGNVFCVNVRNHVICVRRNGRAAFCGNCYDEGKRAAETLMMDYHRQNKVDVRIVRIFNTYGPYMNENDGRVVSNFITQALRGEDLTVYGDGTQTRSFCYIDDLVEGLIRMMMQEEFIGPVNLGNPEEYQVIELARKIIDMSRSDSKIVFKPLPENDPTRRRPDIALAEKMLGWRPAVQVDDGLEKTIDYFRALIRNV